MLFRGRVKDLHFQVVVPSPSLLSSRMTPTSKWEIPRLEDIS